MELISKYPEIIITLYTLVPAIIWFFKTVPSNSTSSIADILSLVSIPIAVELLPYFSTGGSSRATVGAPIDWFFILSFLSLGSLPILTLVVFWFLGRGMGRVFNKLIMKQT